MPPAFAALLQRIRSFSLSIGQLTFGSFLLLLVIIAATSMASVIAIRHIDTTFSDLRRLQDVSDLAEEIDRQMNELRLAARDFVTDPSAQSDRVAEAASELNALLKKTRLELAPEQQAMIDGVSQRLANYREGIEQVSALISRRVDLLAALPPVRAGFEQAVTDQPDRVIARTMFRTQNEIAAALLANDPAGAEQTAQRMRSLTIDGSRLARGRRRLRRHDHRHCRHRERDRFPRQGRARHRRPADRPGDRAAARAQRTAGAGALPRFCAHACGRRNGRASSSARSAS